MTFDRHEKPVSRFEPGEPCPRVAGVFRVPRNVAVGLMILMLLIAACGGSDLTAEEWETTWDEAVERVDTTVDEGVDQADCEHTLGYLREIRPELSPPPIDNLEAPVDAWFDEAEHLFFDCVWVSEDPSADHLSTLHTLEAEVRTVIDVEG